jgi:hypothetical protein
MPDIWKSKEELEAVAIPKPVAKRYNQGKAKLTYVPLALKEGCARGMVYGATKYERDNWKKGFPWTEVMDCLMRHAEAWTEGEDIDAESGLNHLDLLACNAAFLLHMVKHKTGTDDRTKGVTG